MVYRKIKRHSVVIRHKRVLDDRRQHECFVTFINGLLSLVDINLPNVWYNYG